MVSWTMSGDGNISLVCLGRQYHVTTDDERYLDILNALREEKRETYIDTLLDKAKRIKQHLVRMRIGNIIVDDGEVLYVNEDGSTETIHHAIVKRIIKYTEKGLPIHPLVRCLEKFLQNPSYQSSNEGYDFLEHKGLPICEDGDFIAYKAVTHDWLDKYTRKISNKPGDKPSMPRNRVDDNRQVACSKGLHVGTLEYVKEYGHFVQRKDGSRDSHSDRCVVVKVNPKHIVSVPTDHSCQKMRVEQYEVLYEYTDLKEFDYELATNDGDEWVFEEGDSIEFTYKGERRYLRVDEIDDKYVCGELEIEDHNSGYRRFKKDLMEDIVRITDDYFDDYEDEYDDDEDDWE